MYMLTIHHRSTPYSSSTIAAIRIALANKEDVSQTYAIRNIRIQRFIDILERMEDGEMFVGANFVVQCFKKENKDD